MLANIKKDDNEGVVKENTGIIIEGIRTISVTLLQLAFLGLDKHELRLEVHFVTSDVLQLLL